MLVNVNHHLNTKNRPRRMLEPTSQKASVRDECPMRTQRSVADFRESTVGLV